MPSGIESKEEPSLTVVFVCAAIMAAAGALAGVAYMLSFPLQSFSSMADRSAAVEARQTLDPVPGDAFYIEGPVLPGRSWEGKREQLFNGPAGSVSISAGEINAWLAAEFRPVPNPPDEEGEEGLIVMPGQPSVGVSEDGVLYVNIPAKLTGYGVEQEYMLSATGFYQAGAPAKFKIDSVNIDSAKLPLPSVVGAQIAKALLAAYGQFDEYQSLEEAWKRVDSVEVADGGLKLNVL